MKRLLITFVLLCVSSLGACAGPGIPGLQTKVVSFRIIDPEGNPIPGAKLETSRIGSGSNSGIADESGSVSFLLSSEASLFVDASAGGYHRTAGEIWRGGIYKGPQGNLVARKIPDSFTIILKPVLDPVPMVHHIVMETLPAINEPIGFDLEACDWVAPHGRGKITDFIFHFDDTLRNEVELSGTLVLSFPNKGDGIQLFEAPYPFSMAYGSNLAPPHQAPLHGYQPRMELFDENAAGSGPSGRTANNQHALFRTRSFIDPGGIIRKACYGYILGDIKFQPRNPRGPYIQFKYVFNPDPDPEARSLESEKEAP